MIITGKIDVTKIDKQYLFEGKKGKYLDIVLIPTPTSRYGDYMIVQGLPKEVRDAGEKGEILGNAEERGKEESGPKRQESRTREENTRRQRPNQDNFDRGDDSIPF